MKQKVPKVGDCLLLEISHEANKISLPVVVSHVKMPMKYIPGQGETSSGSRGMINLNGYLVVKSNKQTNETSDITSYKVSCSIKFTMNNNFNQYSTKYVKIFVDDDNIETRPNLHVVASELSLPDELIKPKYLLINEGFPKFNVKFRKL